MASTLNMASALHCAPPGHCSLIRTIGPRGQENEFYHFPSPPVPDTQLMIIPLVSLQEAGLFRLPPGRKQPPLATPWPFGHPDSHQLLVLRPLPPFP